MSLTELSGEGVGSVTFINGNALLAITNANVNQEKWDSQGLLGLFNAGLASRSKFATVN